MSAPTPPRLESPQAPRCVVFVHAGPSGDAPPRLEALAAALSDRGRSSRAVAARELQGVRDAIVIFAGDTGAGALLRARLSGNYTLLDVRGLPAGPRFPGGSRLVDGAIFRSRRQQKDLDRPRWTSRVIYDEPEPGLAPHSVAAGEFQAACFGVSAAGGQFGEVRGVAFIDSHPLRHAARFNCHLSLCARGSAELYQPGAEVANAAACGAVLVTTRDAAAVELLGEDYPFYCAGDRGAVEEALARARRLRGGKEWGAALARLREVRARTSLDAVVEQHLELFAALEEARRTSAAPGARPAAG